MRSSCFSFVCSLTLACGANAAVVYAVDGDHIAQIDVDSGTYVIRNAAHYTWNVAGGTTFNTPYTTSQQSVYQYNFAVNTATIIGTNTVPQTSPSPAYAFGEGPDGLYGGGGTSLFRVNTVTGAYTPLGVTTFQFDGDIATVFGGPTPRTYALAGGNLVTLNVATGEMVVVGSSAGSVGLAATADGRLFGHTGNTIIQYNLSTGQNSPIVSISGMGTFLDMGSEVVPAPSVLALAGLGALRLGRRRRV